MSGPRWSQDGAVPIPVVLYLLVTSLYAGFQWTVHVAVYRQFAAVPEDAFPRYENLHQRRVSYLVGPLFGALVLSTGWLGLDRPPTVPGWAPAVADALLAVVLGATAFLAVPQHRRLGVAWDPVAYRALLRADVIRVLAATAGVALAVWLAVVSAG